ncbi:hypothetical protein V8F44DRAFT_642482 [Aspergillus fumigatus]
MIWLTTAYYLFFSSLAGKCDPYSAFCNDMHICLTFMTVKQDLVNYFDASISSLLSRLDDKERRALSVNGQLWMDWLMDLVSFYNVSDGDFRRLQTLEESHNYYEKGVLTLLIVNYTNVLDQCYKTKVPYIRVFEDDIIFTNGWLAKTLHNFTYHYISFVFLLIINVLTITVIYIITIPAFTGLIFMIGKYNISPIHGVMEVNKHGCLLDLVNFLHSMIKEYADKIKLCSFALALAPVQHIGIYSSYDNLEINTQSTWAF